jgi:hypothetical protein
VTMPTLLLIRRIDVMSSRSQETSTRWRPIFSPPVSTDEVARAVPSVGAPPGSKCEYGNRPSPSRHGNRELPLREAELPYSDWPFHRSC